MQFVMGLVNLLIFSNRSRKTKKSKVWALFEIIV